MKSVWFDGKRQHSRLALSIAGSLVAHACITASVWWGSTLRQIEKRELPQAEATVPIEVVLQPTVRERKKTATASGSLHAEGSGNRDSHPSNISSPEKTGHRRSSQQAEKYNLSPSFRPSHTADVAAKSATGFAGSPDTQGSTADGSGYVDDPRAEWGSGGRDFGRIADFLRFDRLYRMIDSRLVYPSVLAYHNVSGTVNARLVITQAGCDWRKTQISASESHLRVYVLDVLQRTCKQSMTEFARRDRASNVDLSFSFAQTEHNDQALIEPQKKIVGNVLLFYRNSHASVAEWKLGPLRGLFPIPAVGVDFRWLQENWDQFVGNPDPMAEFKEKTSNQPNS